MNIAIFDLDGTLCDDRARAHHARARRWDEYHGECVRDPVREAEAFLLRATATTGVAVLALTARPEKFRGLTIEWLEKSKLWPYIWKLEMRPEGDFRRSTDLKLDIYNRYIEAGHRVIFTVEDRKHIVDMWRGLGVTCLHCQEGEEYHATA